MKKRANPSTARIKKKKGTKQRGVGAIKNLIPRKTSKGIPVARRRPKIKSRARKNSKKS